MKAVFALISRNRKLFFKDRGMFFSALITPGILILLYATFLANVYRDSFVSAIPDMITISDKLVDGTVAAQLAAALLAVSCVTVTFCVNLTMVQDRANGTRKDFNVSPISKAQSLSWVIFIYCSQFPAGEWACACIMPWLYVQNGLVYERCRCILGSSR